MRTSATVLLTFLLACALSLRPAAADDEQEVRALLGPAMTTCFVSGSWAMADIGTVQRGDVELVLLRRYKGEWRRMSGAGSLTRGELLALGMSDQTAFDFGLGEVPDKVITGLRSAMIRAGIHHKSFNIVTFRGAFLACTHNDMRGEGCQIWAWVGTRWTPFFKVEPGLSQAELDTAFDAHQVPRFTEYRLLVGRAGTP